MRFVFGRCPSVIVSEKRAKGRSYGRGKGIDYAPACGHYFGWKRQMGEE